MLKRKRLKKVLNSGFLMNIHEYQAKALFHQFDIKTPVGKSVSEDITEIRIDDSTKLKVKTDGTSQTISTISP